MTTNPKAIFLLFTLSLCTIATACAQVYQLQNNATQVTVHGTSTLHDWEELAEEVSGTLTLDTSGEKISIKALKTVIEAESLKSGKGAMDKNTYKALNTDQHKTIIFELTKVDGITANGNGSYSVSAKGDMTISGTTKSMDMNFQLKRKTSVMVVNGETTFKMTQFGIEPPKALMGTIKTGDEITVKYSAEFKQQ